MAQINKDGVNCIFTAAIAAACFGRLTIFHANINNTTASCWGWEGASHAAVFGLAGCLSQKMEKLRKRAPGTKWM
jgi:hypothetical protein